MLIGDSTVIASCYGDGHLLNFVFYSQSIQLKNCSSNLSDTFEVSVT